MPRKSLPIDIRKRVLHEAGYKCGNPVCRSILTLDIHHLVPVAVQGKDDPDNLLALCPNCHALHHQDEIPVESLRAWKMLLLAINEAFDRRSVDLLLALSVVGRTWVSGEGVLECASLIAAGLVDRRQFNTGSPIPAYTVSLTEHGETLVAAWKAGDQAAAIGKL
jgi:hypothetical protein